MNQHLSDVEALQQIELFRGVGERDLAQLAQVSIRRSYLKGKLIVGQDESRGRILIIVRGSAGAYRSSAQGDQVTMGIFPAGEIFGLEFVSPDVRSGSALEALVGGTEAFRMPALHFERFLDLHPVVAMCVVRAVARRYAAMCDRVEDLALYDVTTRVARDAAREAAENLEHRVFSTHREIASRIGTERSEVTKSFRHLRKLGLVRSTPGKRGLVVPDPQELGSHGNKIS